MFHPFLGRIHVGTKTQRTAVTWAGSGVRGTPWTPAMPLPRICKMFCQSVA